MTNTVINLPDFKAAAKSIRKKNPWIRMSDAITLFKTLYEQKDSFAILIEPPAHLNTRWGRPALISPKMALDDLDINIDELMTTLGDSAQAWAEDILPTTGDGSKDKPQALLKSIAMCSEISRALSQSWMDGGNDNGAEMISSSDSETIMAKDVTSPLAIPEVARQLLIKMSLRLSPEKSEDELKNHVNLIIFSTPDPKKYFRLKRSMLPLLNGYPALYSLSIWRDDDAG